MSSSSSSVAAASLSPSASIRSPLLHCPPPRSSSPTRRAARQRRRHQRGDHSLNPEWVLPKACWTVRRKQNQQSIREPQQTDAHTSREWLRSNFVWRAPNPTLLAHATTQDFRQAGCAGCQSGRHHSQVIPQPTDRFVPLPSASQALMHFMKLPKG